MSETEKVQLDVKVPAKGSKENPYKIDEFEEIEDLKSGWSLIWCVKVETGDDSDPEFHLDEKKPSKKRLQEIEDRERERWKNQKEREWRAANMHTQKIKSRNVLTVSAKTTDKDLEKHIEDLKAERASLRQNPAAKMPEYKKKDAPVKVTRIKRLILVEDTEV